LIFDPLSHQIQLFIGLLPACGQLGSLASEISNAGP
jgi:hypothetical protein